MKNQTRLTAYLCKKEKEGTALQLQNEPILLRLYHVYKTHKLYHYGRFWNWIEWSDSITAEQLAIEFNEHEIMELLTCENEAI